MEKRKPNILLTVSLVLIVLAAIVCLIVFLSTRGQESKPNNPSLESSTPAESNEPGETTPSESGETTEATDDTSESELPPSAIDLASLKAELDDCLSGLTSIWQVTIVDPSSGESVSSCINCKQTEMMVAADLPKLFIMATVYQQIESGVLNENDVSSDLNKMIREDSTEAANALTKLLGGGSGADGRKAVNEYAASIGCDHVEFNRLFGESGTQNYVTSGDCATLLTLIAQGKCVSSDASNKMLTLLTGTPGERIPGGVPEGATVAHLNANITGTCCADAGIVFTDAGEVVISIVCNSPYTDEGSTKKCVEITKRVCKYLQGETA